MVIAALMTGAPANADFHPACQPPTSAFAEVGLLFDGELIFVGRVTCNGADTIEITSLTLTPVVPPGSQASGTGENCTTGGCGTVTARGEAAAVPGVYEVSMTFRVTRGALAYTPSRVGRWLWPGAGPPIKLA